MSPHPCHRQGAGDDVRATSHPPPCHDMAYTPPLPRRSKSHRDTKLLVGFLFFVPPAVCFSLASRGGGNRGKHSLRPCLPTTRNGPRHPRNCHSTMFSFIAPYHVPRPPFPSLYHPCRLAFSFSGKGITRAGVPSCNISGRCCSRLFAPGDSLSSVGRGEFNIEILLCRMRYPTERLAGFL